MDLRVDSLLTGAQRAEGIVVIIDVFGAGAMAPLALAQGAPHLVLAATNDDADAMKRRRAGELTIGERGDRSHAEPDLGPSASSVTRADLTDRVAVLSTRTLTMGVNAARHAERIYAAGLLNVRATARIIQSLDPSIVTLVPMGVDGRLRTDEDEICAMILKHVLGGKPPDEEAAVRFIRSCVASQKRQGHAIEALGTKDLNIVLDVDRLDFAVRVSRQDRALMVSREAPGGTRS